MTSLRDEGSHDSGFSDVSKVRGEVLSVLVVKMLQRLHFCSAAFEAVIQSLDYTLGIQTQFQRVNVASLYGCN